jgi:hypothetical protein
LDDHMSVLLDAPAGDTVAVSCTVPDGTIVAAVGATTTPVTGTSGGTYTVTKHVAVNPPSPVVTVIVADPLATPVTSPDSLTVATAELEDVHATVWTVAPTGATVATSCADSPVAKEAVD